MRDPTQRFGDRVEQYVKYRPSYPLEVISTLERSCGLSQDSVVADIGAGTGIFTGLLLQSGATVDIITAAQSFHWFRPEEAREEFARILKPGGWLALVWNARRVDTPFLRSAASSVALRHIPISSFFAATR